MRTVIVCINALHFLCHRTPHMSDSGTIIMLRNLFPMWVRNGQTGSPASRASQHADTDALLDNSNMK